MTFGSLLLIFAFLAGFLIPSKSYFIPRAVLSKRFVAYGKVSGKEKEIFSSLSKDFGLTYQKAKELQSSGIFNSIDCQNNYFSITKFLQDLRFSKKDIKWIIIKCPHIFFSDSRDQISKIYTVFRQEYGFGHNEIHRLIRKKPTLLLKSLETISKLMTVLNKNLFTYEKRASSSIAALLLAKPYIWDVAIEDLHRYLHILRVTYRFSQDELERVLIDKSCSLLVPALTDPLQLQDRLTLFRTYLGFHLLQPPDILTFHDVPTPTASEDLFWKQFIFRYPKLLITSPEYLRHYFEILREEFGFHNDVAVTEFQSFLKHGNRLFYFGISLPVLQLRCQILRGFLQNEYLDIRQDSYPHSNNPSRRQLNQYLEERRFYEDYLSYLESKSQNVSHLDLTQNNYLRFVQSSIDSHVVDILPFAWQMHFEERDDTLTQDDLFAVEESYWQLNREILSQEWGFFSLYLWQEIEYLELSRSQMLPILSKSMLLVFPFSSILKKLGLFAICLGLTTEEIPILLRSQPR